MSDAEPAAPPSQVARHRGDVAPMRHQAAAERFGTRRRRRARNYFLQSAPLGAPDEHVAKTACSKRHGEKSESGCAAATIAIAAPLAPRSHPLSDVTDL